MIVLLPSHQVVTKPSRGTNHSTWSFAGLWGSLPWVKPTGRASANFHFKNMTEQPQLKSWCSGFCERCVLDICSESLRHELFAKSNLFRLHWYKLCWSLFNIYYEVWDCNTKRFENWKLCDIGIGKSQLVFSEQWSSGNAAFFYRFEISVSLFCLPSLGNATLGFLNVSTCCIGLLHSWSKDWLGFTEAHSTLIFSVLLFTSVRPHCTPITCMWKAFVQKMQAALSRPEKVNGWLCSFQR